MRTGSKNLKLMAIASGAFVVVLAAVIFSSCSKKAPPPAGDSSQKPTASSSQLAKSLHYMRFTFYPVSKTAQFILTLDGPKDSAGNAQIQSISLEGVIGEGNKAALKNVDGTRPLTGSITCASPACDDWTAEISASDTRESTQFVAKTYLTKGLLATAVAIPDPSADYEKLLKTFVKQADINMANKSLIENTVNSLLVITAEAYSQFQVRQLTDFRAPYYKDNGRQIRQIETLVGGRLDVDDSLYNVTINQTPKDGSNPTSTNAFFLAKATFHMKGLYGKDASGSTPTIDGTIREAKGGTFVFALPKD